MKALRLLVLVLALCAPASAWAGGFGQFLQIVGTIISFVPGGQVWGYALIVAGSVYGSVEARREVRRQNAKRKAQYNGGLQDRTVTVLRADPPHQVIYGRAIVGGFIADIFTTDKTVIDEVGASRTKADGYKHMVIVFAAHRCQAIHEVYIEGVPLGTLDGSGWTTTGEFFQSRADTRRVIFTDSVVLSETPVAVIQAFSGVPSNVDDNSALVNQTVTIAGNTLNGPAGIEVTVDYTVSTPLASVRVSKHLGSATEPVDAYFASIAPTRYTADHGMRGLTGICITLDLEDSRFQGGPPNITADISGALVYDWRKDSTVPGGSGSHRADDPDTWEHSSDNALCTRDFLTAPYGYNAEPDEVNAAKGIIAADACDDGIDLVVDATTAADQPRYTCNGAFNTDAGAEATLEDLAESMGGRVVYGFDWEIHAGVWTAPVMTLTDDDLRGPLELVQADTPSDQLFNGLRGQYFESGAQSPTDIKPPYQNSAFVTADGQELWHDVKLPFTDNPARARNLCRIFTEKNRAGQILRYPAKLRAWPLKVGDRVTVQSLEYGIVDDTYRVTDWQCVAAGGPLLVLERDFEEIWDLADAASANPAASVDIANPWQVAPLATIAASSGTATLRRNRDGTLTPRVLIEWPALSDAYVLDRGHIEVRYRRPTSNTWLQLPDVPGTETEVWLDQVNEGDRVVIEATAVNKYRARSAPVFVGHTVVGKSALPANVSGLSATAIAGGVLFEWDDNVEADVQGRTRIKVGATWAGGTEIFAQPGRSFTWPWPPAATYAIKARHFDTSGNESASDAALSVTVDDGNLIDTGNAVPEAWTLVVVDEDAAPSASRTRPGVGVFTPHRHALVSASYTNSTGEDVFVEASVDAGAVLTSGAGSAFLVATYFIGTTLDGSDADGDDVTYGSSITAGFQRRVAVGGVVLPDGDTITAEALTIINPDSGETILVDGWRCIAKLTVIKR